MLLSDFEKKKQFLLSHESFFLKELSKRFAFTKEQLIKYKSILNWSYIVYNENIKWSTAIIDEFKDEIFIPDDIYPEFNCNDSLPWSIEFIERYEDLWDWELLAQNIYVMGNPEIRNHFYNRLYPYIEDYQKSCSDDFNNKRSFGQTLADKVERDLDFITQHRELQFQYLEEIVNAKSIDWFRLSQNTFLSWSAELIEKFIDKWDWSELSKNNSVPWDLELIKKFEHKIDWTVDITDEDGGTTLNGTSISANMSIEWDSTLLSTFLHKLNKWDISISECAKWDVDLLIQFNDFWEYGFLVKNKIVWSKVFSEFDAEEFTMPLLDIVLQKNKLIKF